MPTFRQPVQNNQIIINVGLSLKAGDPRHIFKALLDTGAQLTAISPNVVRLLGLEPADLVEVTVASGQSVPVLKYRAWVDIPVQYAEVSPTPEGGNFFSGKEIPVVGFGHSPGEYDVILGMDIIVLFHMTIYGNSIILSN